MDKNEQFLKFLDSVKTSKNVDLLESIKEGFSALHEVGVFRGVSSIESPKTPERRSRATSDMPNASTSEMDDRKAEFARQEKLGRQRSGRISGIYKQLLNYASIAPLDVEEWVESELRPAIKAAKKEMDAKFGSEVSKKGLLGRLKGAARGFMESQESLMEGYSLTLTPEEQKAFDFVGYRYSNGDEWSDILVKHMGPDDEWGAGKTITFDIPENAAWELKDLAEQDDLQFPLFAAPLKEKLLKFIDEIV